MFCSFYLILYIIWFQFSLSLSPFYYFDYYEHQYFTSVLFHLFSFIKNALFGSYSWMSHRTFIESNAVTTAFWLDQYGGRFASIFRRCPPSMFWGQWSVTGKVGPKLLFSVLRRVDLILAVGELAQRLVDEFSDDECKYVVSSIKVGNSESGPYKDVLLTEQSVILQDMGTYTQ